MANVEELDPKPFIELMNRMGLVTRVRDAQGDRVLNPQEESAALIASAKKRAAKIPASYYAKNERPLAQEDRKSVVSGTSVSVRVDLGSRRNIQKQNLSQSH